jgi:two-component system alkaline phosphatase synthesis response regulator PhoP
MTDTTISSQDRCASLSAQSAALILIVDDEPDARHFKRFMLEEDGYQIIEAGDGRVGVEIAIRERPQLIIMNYLMPEMNGLEATAIIRRQPGLEQTPIIMNSACLPDDMRPKALAAGCNDYLEEPCDSDVLIDKVNAYIRPV